MQRLGRLLGNALAVVLAVFSLQAMAADTTLAGRDFNHMTTGFPLNGGHATAACESCHVAGVFKGTAKNCDGCHALGKRIVATPKSTSHIVTDGPCETCHFNTFTFLGAKYNHGTALPGQCTTCHNGRITTGRPASHSAGVKLTDSCDHCHRSYAFLPASWNHIGVTPGTCESVGCHVLGSNQYNRTAAVSPVNHSSYTYTRTSSCDVCHNYFNWTSTTHMPPTGQCRSCHNDIDAKGPLSFTGHATVGTTQDCTDCHSTTTTSSLSWAGALGGKPSNHILYDTIALCSTCHVGTIGTTLNTPSTWHSHVTPVSPCTTCHMPGQSSYLLPVGITQKSYGSAGGSHHSAKAGQDCIDCHTNTYTKWGGAG